GSVTRIFTGWMFADSPALNAIDHAVYDIWLIDCKQSTDVAPPTTLEGTKPPVAEPTAEAEPADDRG
ncbi:MAG: DUF2155 domain-containing protein, partial [Devosia sp.]